MNPLLPLPLPTPPPGLRPAPQLFGWGLGDAGQLGLSLDLAENIPIIRKPRCNRYVEQKMAENALGGVGAGLETVAAGGMHSLMVDETGTVWSCGANDNAALGRVTIHTTDPAEPSRILEIDESTHLPNTVPVPIQSLVNERFRAVKVVAGDSISAAISDTGALRVWGTFRVSNRHSRAATSCVFLTSAMTRANKAPWASPPTQCTSSHPPPCPPSQV